MLLSNSDVYDEMADPVACDDKHQYIPSSKSNDSSTIHDHQPTI